MTDLDNLREHADHMDSMMRSMRESGMSDSYEYIAVAKEYRLTVKQIAEMKPDEKPAQSGLAALRVTVGRRVANG